MIQQLKILKGACAILALLFLVGCIGGKSPGVTYYRLAPMETPAQQQPVADNDKIVLGVGPITIADYLKKAQIATRVGGSRYEFNDFHRWAGIIEQDINNVVKTNLSILLGTDKVMLFPWRQYFKPDYRVEIDISQFDAALDSDAQLKVQWTIVDRSGATILASESSSYNRELDAANFDELIAAENALLEAFSRDVADRISMLAR